MLICITDSNIHKDYEYRLQCKLATMDEFTDTFGFYTVMMEKKEKRYE